MKLTPRSLDAAADWKAPRAEKHRKPRQMGRANATILCNGNAIAEPLNDLRKARREEDKSNGTFPAWLMLESAAILYSKGKSALQADGWPDSPSLARSEISNHGQQAECISIAANPTDQLLRASNAVFSCGAGRGRASAGTPAFAGALASGAALGIPADNRDARRIAWR